MQEIGRGGDLEDKDIRRLDGVLDLRRLPVDVIGQGMERAQQPGLAARLDSVSYMAVLARGFALVTDEGGHAVTAAAGISPGARLNLRFEDGAVAATAGGAPTRRGAGRGVPAQESLL